MQVNGILLGLSSLVIPSTSPFWWVGLVFPLAVIVKLAEVLCIHLLIKDHMKVSILDPEVLTAIGDVGGVLTAVKIYLPPITLTLIAMALVHGLVSKVGSTSEKQVTKPTTLIPEAKIPQIVLIVLTFIVPTIAAVLHLMSEHPADEKTLAGGPSCWWAWSGTYSATTSALMLPTSTPSTYLCR